eukprot:tig00000361_g24387.t1
MEAPVVSRLPPITAGQPGARKKASPPSTSGMEPLAPLKSVDAIMKESRILADLERHKMRLQARPEDPERKPTPGQLKKKIRGPGFVTSGRAEIPEYDASRDKHCVVYKDAYVNLTSDSVNISRDTAPVAKKQGKSKRKEAWPDQSRASSHLQPLDASALASSALDSPKPNESALLAESFESRSAPVSRERPAILAPLEGSDARPTTSAGGFRPSTSAGGARMKPLAGAAAAQTSSAPDLHDAQASARARQANLGAGEPRPATSDGRPVDPEDLDAGSEAYETRIFRKSVARLQALWDELRVPDEHRSAFADRYFAFSTVNHAAITDEIVRLTEHHQRAAAVRRAIEGREVFVEQLRALVTSAPVFDVPAIAKNVTSLRLATIECVEAVLAWRRALGDPAAPFYWRRQNYLLKMKDDLDFLGDVDPSLWKSMPILQSPLLSLHPRLFQSPYLEAKPHRKGPTPVSQDAARVQAAHDAILAEVARCSEDPAEAAAAAAAALPTRRGKAGGRARSPGRQAAMTAEEAAAAVEALLREQEALAAAQEAQAEEAREPLSSFVATFFSLPQYPKPPLLPAHAPRGESRAGGRPESRAGPAGGAADAAEAATGEATQALYELEDAADELPEDAAGGQQLPPPSRGSSRAPSRAGGPWTPGAGGAGAADWGGAFGGGGESDEEAAWWAGEEEPELLDMEVDDFARRLVRGTVAALVADEERAAAAHARFLRTEHLMPKYGVEAYARKQAERQERLGRIKREIEAARAEEERQLRAASAAALAAVADAACAGYEEWFVAPRLAAVFPRCLEEAVVELAEEAALASVAAWAVEGALEAAAAECEAEVAGAVGAEIRALAEAVREAVQLDYLSEEAEARRAAAAALRDFASGLAWELAGGVADRKAEEARRIAEHAARVRAEEEARAAAEREAARLREEAERAREAELQRLDEEARRAALEAEEHARTADEAVRRAAEGAARAAEESARRREEEAARLAREAEERRAREEAEAKARADEEARLKAEEEARAKAEAEAKARAEEEARARAEEEARLKSEAEAKAKADEEARLRADEEARAKAEAEAKAAAAAEEEARKAAEEEAAARAKADADAAAAAPAPAAAAAAAAEQEPEAKAAESAAEAAAAPEATKPAAEEPKPAGSPPRPAEAPPKPAEDEEGGEEGPLTTARASTAASQVLEQATAAVMASLLPEDAAEESSAPRKARVVAVAAPEGGAAVPKLGLGIPEGPGVGPSPRKAPMASQFPQDLNALTVRTARRKSLSALAPVTESHDAEKEEEEEEEEEGEDGAGAQAKAPEAPAAAAAPPEGESSSSSSSKPAEDASASAEASSASAAAAAGGEASRAAEVPRQATVPPLPEFGERPASAGLSIPTGRSIGSVILERELAAAGISMSALSARGGGREPSHTERVALLVDELRGLGLSSAEISEAAPAGRRVAAAKARLARAAGPEEEQEAREDLRLAQLVEGEQLRQAIEGRRAYHAVRRAAEGPAAPASGPLPYSASFGVNRPGSASGPARIRALRSNQALYGPQEPSREAVQLLGEEGEGYDAFDDSGAGVVVVAGPSGAGGGGGGGGSRAAQLKAALEAVSTQGWTLERPSSSSSSSFAGPGRPSQGLLLAEALTPAKRAAALPPGAMNRFEQRLLAGDDAAPRPTGALLDSILAPYRSGSSSALLGPGLGAAAPDSRPGSSSGDAADSHRVTGATTDSLLKSILASVPAPPSKA